MRLWCDRYVLWLPRRGTFARDLALAGIALVGGVLMLSLGAYRQMQPTFWGATPVPLFLPPLVVVCVAVVLRRVAPRTSLAVGVVALLADLALGGSLGTILIFTQVLYDACVYGPPRLWRRPLRISDRAGRRERGRRRASCPASSRARARHPGGADPRCCRW